ncbi:SDR family oxidoreductase [Streptomyces sp. DR7-3]|uniref:SDR family NAD(P)-dependent oxidoreductase n=1 Tax=Streptomyces malaysiensis TaxID=92644 RepID=UPI002043A999|nr:SDR family oxidoreductase [Streptomyces sp. DR7-3]MCM3809409.1 SDR family oxidoreductase [Streptomyces sp. DR7-3]
MSETSAAPRQHLGRIAWVTAAGSGICAETARRLAARGCRVVLIDRDEQAVRAVARELPDGLGVPVCADVTDTGAMVRLVAESAAELPDVLVNGVGGDTRSIPVAELTETDLWRSLSANLLGTFTLTRLCTPAMADRGHGRVVNLASIAGRTYTHFSNAAYVAAKAAVIGFTKQCAYELAPRGVVVNAVAHGPIATERVAAAWDGMEPARREAITGRTPAARLGTVAEAAAAVVHLCDEDAGYTTGSVLDVNGGLHI